MNKAIVMLLLILVAAFSQGNFTPFAHAEDVNLNGTVRIGDESNIFGFSNQESEQEKIQEQNKNKTQFRIKDNHNDEDSEFMIKGVITSSSSGSIVIDNKTINIDSSVTGDVKIVGKIEVGAYAMAKGIVKDSNLYAEKIVVDQRNKKDLEESDAEDLNASPTPTVSPTPTPVSTQSAATEEPEKSHDANLNLDLSNIILSVQNFLNYLRELAQKI
ncbi:MAG: hypothetical protein M1444_04095 [Patescibacteria group bacterium]|nr:hypothetical protein [Patescibacteria group bacterium]